ncbi:MAG: small nuclear ribonucleoprotein [Methanobacteriota archaeon]|nr:MAG: small nuclear ribonucleoprotein [Euryarchaeota archaeon]
MAKPFDLLNEMVGKNVVVGIKGGKEFRGKVLAFDIHMNLSLTDVKIVVGEETKEVPKLFLRGDSIVYMYLE